MRLGQVKVGDQVQVADSHPEEKVRGAIGLVDEVVGHVVCVSFSVPNREARNRQHFWPKDLKRSS